jgi:ubiquinone/menaquinone biosynthesis C-methylase UbiE
MTTHDQPDFDHMARIYRWAEYASLGPVLQRARTHFLPELRECRRAVVLGDGDGRFLARLMAQNPAMQAVAVDTSAVMLELLHKNCAHAATDTDARLTLLRASALQTKPAPETDLIVTHFFLDCLTQVEVDALTESYAATLKPGTMWLVSDFALPHITWLRPFAAAYIRALYFAFRLLTGLRVTQLPNTQKALQRAGFARIASKEFINGLIFTELWRLG